ncbi:MAG: autotransporter outer membrane beta-barrel domain-containing protein, partial [Opitutaceae bacterium]|nr:autotransporter outer membrane beta-barrel domain-containing protein [Opitutaceae bacterium]
LAGAGGVFAMHTRRAAGAADRLRVDGAATGAHRILITDTGDPAALTGLEPPLLLVQTAAGDATFTGTLSAGLYDYTVQNGAQLAIAARAAAAAPAPAAAPAVPAAPAAIAGLPATNWYLHRAGLSATASAIINTTAMLGRDWHYSLDTLHQRLGDVRAESLHGTYGSYGTYGALGDYGAHKSHESHNSHASHPPAATGNIWTRARAYRLNAGAALAGRAFDEYACGLTAGGDRAFRLDGAATLLAGAFIDMGRIDRDFAGAGDTGRTGTLSAGLYGTWLHDAGWHADLVLKADRYKHRFDTLTTGARPVHGAYSSDAQGVSLELGRRLERSAGWWIEPAAQAAVAWLRGATYRTAPGNQTLDVAIDTAESWQYRLLARFGRRPENSRWLPYGKFGVVRTCTAGGAIHAGGETFATAPDGWREELGVGAGYLVNERAQLYLDYEYGRAAHYERPWSLNLGYRRLW